MSRAPYLAYGEQAVVFKRLEDAGFVCAWWDGLRTNPSVAFPDEPNWFQFTVQKNGKMLLTLDQVIRIAKFLNDHE